MIDDNEGENKKAEEDTELSFKQITKLFENYEFRHFKYDFFEKIALLIISALGFVTALAWGEAAKITFQQIFGNFTTIIQRFIYAGAITVLAVILSLTIGKLFIRKRK